MLGETSLDEQRTTSVAGFSACLRITCVGNFNLRNSGTRAIRFDRGGNCIPTQRFRIELSGRLNNWLYGGEFYRAMEGPDVVVGDGAVVGMAEGR